MDERAALVERLRQSVDDHDLDAMVDCFATDYVNETPAHPGRGFTGRDQVFDRGVHIARRVASARLAQPPFADAALGIDRVRVRLQIASEELFDLREERRSVVHLMHTLSA